MQFHPKSGRSIRPATSADSDLLERRAWTREHDLARHGVRSGPSAERIAQIRQRLESGYYNSAAAMDALAGRLLAAGAM